MEAQMSKAGLYFNSRPCERGDPPSVMAAMAAKFQFPPLREGRLFDGVDFPPGIISIPAPARGAT